jgi:hypothetical protein
MLRLLDGRDPHTPDEVALTRGAASRLSVRTGDTVQLGGIVRTVVGTVENPTEIDDEFALVAPQPGVAADAPPSRVQHVDLPRYSSAPNSLITEAAMTRHGGSPRARAGSSSHRVP